MFAILLGAAVLFSQHNGPMLANFIGIYWLLGGVLMIQWARTVRWERGSRLGLAAGTVGIIAASIVLLRHELEHVISFQGLLVVLGIAAVLTGSLRFWVRSRSSSGPVTDGRSVGSPWAPWRSSSASSSSSRAKATHVCSLLWWRRGGSLAGACS